MLLAKDFAYTDKITPEQIAFVDEFKAALFDDDRLADYWGMVSDTDKALTFGYYDANIQHGLSPDMITTITELRDKQRELFGKVRENAGISNLVRYTKDGEGYIYLFENIKVSVTYIAETEAVVYPLRVVIDARWEDHKINARLKARVYDDSFRTLEP